jgi:hypothetical protein
VPEQRGDERVWRDTLQRPAPARRPPLPAPPPIDEARLRRLRQLPASEGILQMDYFYSNATIQREEDERPWFPKVVLAVDAVTGYVFGSRIAAAEEVLVLMVEQLLEVIERMEARPARVTVTRPEAMAILKPLAARLGIRLVLSSGQPALEDARRSLADYLACT